MGLGETIGTHLRQNQRLSVPQIFPLEMHPRGLFGASGKRPAGLAHIWGIHPIYLPRFAVTLL